ncbi:Na+/H+ antiporter NhaC family protein [Glaesserella sp.]|uniref:Na+/H+ antiporter NhaC family protein n=1 Tax=Glaesserella sp. TaxID=2094731 RepID=UPI00359FB487
MQDYGIWAVLTPLLTILLAVLTRQVILSLLTGSVFGFIVLHDFHILVGIKATLDGIIHIFADGGNAKTIIFMVLIGGIMRLVVVTGGMRSLVQALSEKSQLIKGRRSVQLLAMIITSLIFVESSINQLVAGVSTKKLAEKYAVPPEKMSYIIQTSCVSVCSSAMINGWGAAMMGVIGVQISKGFLSGEPFEILAGSMVYHFMAFFSLATVLFYIFTGASWGPMRKAELLTKYPRLKRKKIQDQSQADQNDYVIDHPNSNSILNFLIPILSTVLTVPVMLYITGHGDFSKGSGSTSVYYAVIFGLSVSFVWFMARRLFTIDSFFKEIYIGFASMVKISSVMIFAFLMGSICGDLHTGAYIAKISSSVIPPSLTIGFIFLISAIMSLATGTSWGTFAIMIPIGVQLGVSVGVPPEYMIGAAISGSIFGDMTSPISSDAIVASMATDCEHIEHIRTQFPYALVTGIIALLAYIVLGLTL